MKSKIKDSESRILLNNKCHQDKYLQYFKNYLEYEQGVLYNVIVI